MCEVSYKTYNGENKDVFLQEGDKIAVISPSALPSREQTDAVLAGIVFGEWTDLSPDLDDYSGVNRGGAYTSVADMISRQFLPDISCPVAFGFPAGHGDTNYPLLMGEKAKLKVDPNAFTLELGAE